MVFAGLALSSLLGIFAVVGALTLGLYILKLRRRPVSVPFSPIWKRVLKDKEATHLFSQLKRLLSLLLQLALVALIVFALGDPRLSDAWSTGRNIVVLVDASASMQATDVTPSRVEVGKKKLNELVAGLTGTDRMLIAEMGQTPRALSAMSSDVAELSRAVKEIRAVDTEADLERGLRFALDALRGLERAEIIVVSDGALDVSRCGSVPLTDDTKLTYVPVGEGGSNVAITAFSVRRYPLDKSRYEVLLTVSNTNDKPVEVELTLIGDGQTVDVTTLALGPNESLPRIYQDLAGASRTLEAKISIKGSVVDQLAADNHAYALMPERRRIRVLLVTSGNRYVEAALLLDEYLEVTLVSPTDPLPTTEFDVSILDRVAPELRRSHGARLYLKPPADGPVPYRTKELTDFGFDSWEKNSPFLRWMALDNIQVAKGFAFSPEKADAIVGASHLGPILVSGKRDGQRFLALSFDPRDSDFVLRVGWPLFLLNTINHFASEDTSYVSSYRTGDVWQIPAPGSLERVRLRTPAGTEEQIPVQAGNAVYLGEVAGFYDVLGADGETLTAFAANLSDLPESTLAVVPTLNIAGHSSSAAAGFRPGVRQELWLYLILAALGISLIEWFSYHRRVTV